VAKTGRKEKAPGGFTEVLFLRASREMIAALDGLLLDERLLHPHRMALSRADLVREILGEAIEQRKKARA
jgi:hypothetical protein